MSSVTLKPSNSRRKSAKKFSAKNSSQLVWVSVRDFCIRPDKPTKAARNNGVFLQITSEDAMDLDVPKQKYTFGIVKAAQARGDFQVLLDRDRRALRVHLGADVKNGLEKILI